MIKRLLLLLLAFVLMACVPSLDDATPSQEVWLTDTPVIIPTVRAEPPPYIIHGDASLPEAIAGGYSFDLHNFYGTVGVTTGWQDTNARTCYLGKAEATIGLENALCDFTPMAYNFLPVIHYTDGAEHTYSPLLLRMGALDNVNGHYKLEAPLLLYADGDSFFEMRFNVIHSCANFGNTVAIFNVSLEAVSPDYCAVLGG